MSFVRNNVWLVLMETQKKLTLIFRDKRKGNNSIERLFTVLKPYFEDQFETKSVTLPEQPSGSIALLKNIFYALKKTKGIRHVTGDAQYLAICMPSKRTVLTIHDCGYLVKLKGLKKWLYKWIWYKLPCLRASRITVISESTRQVLESEVGAFENKLSIIDNCVTIDMRPTQRLFNSTFPRILQIGSGDHKNLDNLIRAVKDLPCELKIVGKISEKNLEALSISKVAYTNESDVSDKRIEEIYHECDILFFASRHEGFGLPILEGNAAGIPVITSNCYSMPYVAGDAAILVDPESFRQIRQALEQIIANTELREDLVKKGKINLDRFSASSIAKQYINIYKSLMEND